MGEVRRPQDDIKSRLDDSTRQHRFKPRKNPCERPPGKPTFVGEPGPMDFEIRFRVEEAKTHLNFFGYATWDEQTQDTNGLPFEGTIDRYVVQWKMTTDAAGLIYALDTGGDKIKGRKTVQVEEDRKNQSIEVTGATGGTIAFFYGDAGPSATVAHNASAAAVRTAIGGLAGINIGDITATGGPLGTNPVVLEFAGEGQRVKLRVDSNLTGPNPTVTVQAKDRYFVYFGHMPRPKRLYVSARIKVRAGAGCWSDWSEWTTPIHPFDGSSEPSPPIPANTDLDFDHDHAHRGDPLRAIVSGDYVGPWDVPGGDTEDDVSHYVIQLQFSKDGGATWRWPPREHHKRDRDDNDGRWRVVFHNIRRDFLYRYRVCSVDRFHRRGLFGPGAFNANQRLDGWSAAVDPQTFDDPPPAPTFEYADIDRAKLHLQLAEPSSRKVETAYYQWEVYHDSVTVGNRLHKDEFHLGLHKVFPLRKPAQWGSIIARARAVSGSDETSAWTQITCAAHVPPTPGISGAGFDVNGPRHARYRAIVPVTVSEASHNDHIKVIVVQMVHKTANANPTGSDHINKDMVHVGDSPQAGIFKGIPKRHYVFVRARTRDDDGKESPWSHDPTWLALGRPIDSGATSTPGAPTSVSVSTSAPRRVVGTWADPDDDEATRWRVITKRGATQDEDVMVRNNRHVYRVPKADVGSSHSMEVYAINDMGVQSTLGSSSASPTDDSGRQPGDVRWHPGTSIPSDAYHCDGSSKSTAGDPNLFAAIGYSYGGSGASFNVPEIRGRTPRGIKSTGESIGDNDAATEANRETDHDEIDADTTGGTAHPHNIPSFNTGPAGVGSASGGSGSPTDLTRIAHGHTTGLQTTASGGFHEHHRGAGTKGPNGKPSTVAGHRRHGHIKGRWIIQR